MKFVLFASFLALASSVPLGQSIFQWPVQGSGQGQWQQENWMLPQQLVQQGSGRQLAQQITEILQQTQIQNAALQQQGVNPLVGQNSQRLLAQQGAQQIVQQIEQARQSLVQNIIQQLQQQLQQQQQWGVQSVNKQFQQNEMVNVIQELRQIQQQELFPSQGLQNQFVQTLAVALEAQLLVSSNSKIQQKVRTGKIVQEPVQSWEVFQVRVQDLVDQIRLQAIQMEITRQEGIFQQLKQVQQFVNQQRQQIQNHQTVAQQKIQQQLTQQLPQQTLQQQEQQLQQQQLGRLLVVQQLQQALVDQQKQLQENILKEQSNEVSPVGNVWSQAGNIQTGHLWTQAKNPTQVMNLLSESGITGNRQY